MSVTKECDNCGKDITNESVVFEISEGHTNDGLFYPRPKT